MTNREGFFLKNQKFFDAGLVNEIYGNENISIMNVCNSFYVVSQYAHDKGFNYSACAITAEDIRKLVETNELLAVWIYNMDDEQLRNHLIQFNDQSFEIMKSIKSRTDKEGPTDQIDLEMEEELLQKNKSK